MFKYCFSSFLSILSFELISHFRSLSCQDSKQSENLFCFVVCLFFVCEVLEVLSE